MPFLLTQDLINSTKQPDPGWSFVVLKDVKEDKNKKDSAYTDTRLIFECITGPGDSKVNAGRVCTLLLSGKAYTMEVSEVIRNIVNFFCAAMKKREEELVGMELDFKAFKGYKVWADIRPVVTDGKTYMNIQAFAPDDIVPF